jgi:hypothetical protein
MIASLAVLALPILAASQVPIARRGQAVATIVVSPSASEPEKHAAEELHAYLSRIAGADIPLRNADAGTKGPVVWVGQSERVKSLCPDIDWAHVGEEELVLRSVEGGFVVAGGVPRGTLYAAYKLLDRLGVRWWTIWATDVPSNPNLSLPSMSLREKPKLEYRSSYWHAAFNPDWAVHNGLNFWVPSMAGAHGGGVDYAGFVHTYYSLVDPAVNFPLHPEWFSLIDGKRTTDNAQLCTTNPEMRAYMLEQVKKLLRANPNARIVSVSQNDCGNQCQCDRCQALAKAEGSQSAPVIDLANYIADGIAKEFPNVAVDTLAYQWSRHAPKTLKPRKNVIVRLCSIECDFGSPLNAPKNHSFAKDVLDWSHLTNRLYVWDYVTNFANYLLPIPNEAVLGPNLKFLYAHGVRGVFAEGDYSSNGGASSELKTWLLAKLLWNPDADSKALTNEFLTGYYGAAGNLIGEYLRDIDAAGAESQVTIYQDVNAPYLTPALLYKLETIMQAAEQQVAGKETLLWRVKQFHLPLRFVFLKRWDELKKASVDLRSPWMLGTRDDAIDDWQKTAMTGGPPGWQAIDQISESGYTAAQFVADLKAQSH